ncbi:hypothetical protein NLU13_5051 [Sarocladium strictum]|uniref:Carboxypeptidase M14B n=1 Tax=Sarocladium strictum TaxID=5046 RepID=A0AA39GK21_SARSR|nr:hypothetical protein NLU13_5051 [Sarocladium strictum]
MRYWMISSVGLILSRTAVSAQGQLIYADNQVPVSKDPAKVAANFEHVQGIKLLSPAFTNLDNLPESRYFLQKLAARNSWMTYHNPTWRSEEGRSLPYVFLSTSTSANPGHLESYGNATSSAPSKVRVWLQGGVHGNEPAGDQALLALLGKMDADQAWASSILDKVDILVLPRYNPDGVSYFQRYFASSFDPNRDHTKLARQQTRDIKSLVMSYAPHVGVDLHEYSASRGYGEDAQWLSAQDGQFSAMKNLNIHRDIRRLFETMFADAIAAATEKHGLRWSPYVVGDLGTDDIVLEETTGDAKMGDTSVGLSQAVMFLYETRGIGLADQHFQRRVATGLIMLGALLETASNNAEEVLETIESAREDFINGDHQIVLTDYPVSTEIDWTYIHANNGSITTVPVTFMNSTQAQANLTRPRPEAYIFSRAWSDAADRLRAAGVVVDELTRDFSGEVVALNITAAEVVATGKYEGVARTTNVATEEKRRRNVTIPAGGYVVSTRQKNAAHAFNVLEPENMDSYVVFNILPVDVGDEYQVYSVPRQGS